MPTLRGTVGALTLAMLSCACDQGVVGTLPDGATKDGSGGGDQPGGDRAGGDRLSGDPTPGDLHAGDPTVGDPTVGDPTVGDPTVGDPTAGDPAVGDPMAGDPTQEQTVLYVAPTGSGSVCSLGDPCALVTARDRVRSINQSMTEHIRILLRGGTYEVTEPFTLGPADSGSNGFAVIWEGYAGEEPVLSGGVRVSGWTLQDAGRNIYGAAVSSSLHSRQLYVDGVRAQRARGSLHPSGFIETAEGYTAPDASMAGWGNIQDIEIVSLVYWKTFRCGVESIVGTAVTVDPTCWGHAQFHTPFDMALPSWIENAYEILDEPGEWYHDRAAAHLYYIPRPGEDLSTATVVAPVLETVLSAVGTIDDPVHDLELRGLTFSYATWLAPDTANGYPCVQAGYHLTGTPGTWTMQRTPGNVVFRQAHRVLLERNTFTHLGAYALVLEYGSKDNLIVGNRFRDISSGGIQIGDVDRPWTTDNREMPERNVVRNNFITETGREYFDGVAIFAGYTADTHIDHNEIRNVTYSGISVGWGWTLTQSFAQGNQVTHNLGSRVMQRLDDGGHIYTLSTQPDSLISGNFFHDQVGPYGSIYLDQGTQYYTIEDNVVASAPYWYILQPVVAPRAQNNVVQDNFSDTASEYCCGAQGCCDEVNTFANNTVFSPGTWPVDALGIIGAAGIERTYDDIRDTTVRVEAENYAHGGAGVGYQDMTAGNTGGARRGDDVDLYRSAACSADVTVGYTQSGEWLDYTIDTRPGGHYDFIFVVATEGAGNAIELVIDGVSRGSVTLPETGSYQVFTSARIADVTLSAAPHRVRLVLTGGFNLDYFEYAPTMTACDAGTPTAVLQADFDADSALDTLSIYQGALCWGVSSAGGAEELWLDGWGSGNRNLTGDFNGDGRGDVVLILQASLTWHLALSFGRFFAPVADALTGWGMGHVEPVADFNGDGLDDVVVIYFEPGDGQWHWHLAESHGAGFIQYPDAHVGTDPGASSCVRDIDADGAGEIVVPGSPTVCADLDAGTRQFAVAVCAATCS
ncbi:carbohydrate-binding protein [Myxococcota bacterium]